MKKILYTAILSVFILSIFAIPSIVSAKNCEELCDDSYDGGEQTACETGCSKQGPECGVSCNKYTDIAENQACHHGCRTGSTPISSINDVESLITAVARWISIIVSVIAVIFIILGGASYITSGGDEEKAGAAKQKIVYGLIGLAIAAVAWGAEALVRSFLKLGQ